MNNTKNFTLSFYGLKHILYDSLKTYVRKITICSKNNKIFYC
jgi:hypothetical protein